MFRPSDIPRRMRWLEGWSKRLKGLKLANIVVWFPFCPLNSQNPENSTNNSHLFANFSFKPNKKQQALKNQSCPNQIQLCQKTSLTPRKTNMTNKDVFPIKNGWISKLAVLVYWKVPSLKLAVRTWKWWFGRGISFWVSAYFQGQTFFLGGHSSSHGSGKWCLEDKFNFVSNGAIFHFQHCWKKTNFEFMGFLRGGVQGEGVPGEPWGFLGNLRED